MQITAAGIARVARARCADHQGSAQLPRGLNVNETIAAGCTVVDALIVSGVRRAVSADALGCVVQRAATGAAVQPAFAGRVFGIALIRLVVARVSCRRSTARDWRPLAKVSGHVNWLTGVLLLVWLLGLRTP